MTSEDHRWEQPDEDRALTFLFAHLNAPLSSGDRDDIVGGATAHAGEAALRAAVERHGGRAFKDSPGGLLAVFDAPERAVLAAIDAQRALAATAPGWSAAIALNSGPAYARNGDYFGPALNRCARLLSLAQAGQVLATPALVDAVGPGGRAQFRQIGVNPLDDPHQGVAIHQVLAEGLARDFVPLPDPTGSPNNLPRALPSLFGRDEAMLEVQRTLAQARWVTLLGPGGLGKTRLALEVGARLVDSRREEPLTASLRQQLTRGVWFVELEAVADTGVAAAVAMALEIELAGVAPPMEELAARLQHVALLLILDNCEHILPGVARFGRLLAARCPGVRVLATSQGPVELPGETVVSLDTLALPPDGADVAQALTCAAVALFQARAQAVDPRFEVEPRNVRAVVGICRRLDGLPLAIEMAAGRAPLLGAAAVEQRLGDRLALLSSTRRGAGRQQTLEATIDWSYGLLDPGDQAVLRRLSIFVGGWSGEAAQHVAGDEEAGHEQVGSAIARLAQRSLLVLSSDEDSGRGRMLESIRVFAAARLETSGEAIAVRRRHLSAVRTLAERCFADAWVEPDAAIRACYLPDLDNVRAALDWGLEAPSARGEGLKLIGAAEPLFTTLGLLQEARARLEAATGLLRETDSAATIARVWLGYGLALGFSHPRGAYEAVSASLPQLRAEGDPRLLGRALVMMGRFAQVVADHAPRSPQLIDEAAPYIRRSGVERLEAHYFRAQGNRAAADGDYAKSVAMMREGYAAFVRAGATGAASAIRTSLAYMLWASGELDAALGVCREVLAERRASAFVDGSTLGFVLGNLAGMLVEKGELEEAAEVIREAVPLLLEPWQIWVVFDHLALFLARTSRIEEAAEAAGFTDRSYADHGAVRQPNERRARDSLEALLRGALSPRALALSMEDGARLSRSDAASLITG